MSLNDCDSEWGKAVSIEMDFGESGFLGDLERIVMLCRSRVRIGPSCRVDRL
jgi:hypothetical protein